MDFDIYNFGGYVINDKGKLATEEMKVVNDNTPKDKPKYAMGVGKPEDIVEAAKLGYTIFDTVLVTRNARHGTLYTSDGIVRINNAQYSLDTSALDANCDCETCKNHTKAYLHHMLRIDEATGMVLATIHNLRYYQKLVEDLNIQYGYV